MAGALPINRLMQVYSCIIWLAMSVAQRWRHCLMRATWTEQISWLPLSWDDKLSSKLEYALYQLGTYTQHAYWYWRHTNSRSIPLFLIFVLIDCVCQSHVPILAVFKMIKQVKYGPTQITHNSPCGTFCWWLFFTADFTKYPRVLSDSEIKWVYGRQKLLLVVAMLIMWVLMWLMWVY